jgi:hypothetical protein
VSGMRVFGYAVICLIILMTAALLYLTVRAPNAHEILAMPGVIDCRWSPTAMSLEAESTRLHGFIVEPRFGCAFYWHEAHSGGN